MEDQPPVLGRSIDLLGQGAQTYPSPLMFLHHVDEVSYRAPKAVELLDHERVTRAYVGERLGLSISHFAGSPA